MFGEYEAAEGVTILVNTDHKQNNNLIDSTLVSCTSLLKACVQP